MADIRNTSKKDDPPPLTPKQRQDWNTYVDWLDKKGMKGHPDLDKKDISFQYLDQFIKENPSTSLSRDTVKPIQDEMTNLAINSRALAARKNDPNADKLMQGTSISDGIPGSRTTRFKFPEMVMNQYRNNSLTSSQNLGLVDSKLQAQGIAANKKPLPKGVKLEPLYDSSGKQTGMGYTDPQTGDTIQYQQ
jgi:hypothetical protein